MPHSHIPLATAGLLLFVIAVAIVDLRSRRIPNLLTAPAAAAGVLAAWVTAGGSGVLHSVGGLLTGLAAFIPFYIARGFGAGDVKAMAAIGAFLGPQGALLAAAWTLVAGAIGGLLLLAARGGYPAIRALLSRWVVRAGVLSTTGNVAPIEPAAGDPARHRFPYGLAIACGTAVSLAWN